MPSGANSRPAEFVTPARNLAFQAWRARSIKLTSRLKLAIYLLFSRDCRILVIHLLD